MFFEKKIKIEKIMYRNKKAFKIKIKNFNKINIYTF